MKVLIVGQGLAGSLLAWFLIRKGADVTIVDDRSPSSATAVAAGIMLPFTGRRLVKTWKAETLIPFASKTYREIELLLDKKFYFEKDVLQLFSSPGNRNDWISLSADPSAKPFLGKIFSQQDITDDIINNWGGIELKQSGYIDTVILKNTISKYIAEKGTVITDSWNMDAIHNTGEGTSTVETLYGLFSKVIFCEGFNAKDNFYFRYLPFNPAKGEIINIDSQTLQSKYIITNGIFILPLGNAKFRVGSTYEWKDLTAVPTTEARVELEDELKKTINVPYSVTGHHAAVRPATRDRRPFLGFHSRYNSIGIFNGLGTKGAMLAPFYANQMAEVIMDGKIPDADVSCNRFGKNQ